MVIAAITSCTNTSNPQVMLGAALLARKAVERGLTAKPWVKTTLAPGSKVVMDYYEQAGLMPYLEKLGFHLVGYGCTTCIGNSGPLPEEISAAVQSSRPGGRLGAVRQPQLRGPDQPRREDELPRLAAAGRRVRDGRHHGHRPRHASRSASTRRHTGVPGATSGRRRTRSRTSSTRRSPREMFATDYADVFAGDERWRSLPTPTGETFTWDAASTYVRKPPYFEGMAASRRRSPTSPARACWPSSATR